MNRRLMHAACLCLAVGTMFCLSAVETAKAALYNPGWYMASLHFDGTDNADSGEHAFPVQGSANRLMNSYYDFNDSGSVTVEDDLEVLMEYAIGTGIYGTTRTGETVSSSHYNSQRPATYWKRTPLTGSYANWVVYEYWLYYADNDWLNDHEHDWERYFIYFYNGSLQRVRCSQHDHDNRWDWSYYVSQSLVEDSTHLKLSVDGGSHAFREPSANPTIEDGVRIKWDGYVNQRSGRLDQLSGTTSWYIFSNNPDAAGVTSYTLSPGTYYYGDPYYFLQTELSNGQDAPWNRTIWNTPPDPYQDWP